MERPHRAMRRALRQMRWHLRPPEEQRPIREKISAAVKARAAERRAETDRARAAMGLPPKAWPQRRA